MVIARTSPHCNQMRPDPPPLDAPRRAHKLPARRNLPP
jgi:hypothetical protein